MMCEQSAERNIEHQTLIMEPKEVSEFVKDRLSGGSYRKNRKKQKRYSEKNRKKQKKTEEKIKINRIFLQDYTHF